MNVASMRMSQESRDRHRGRVPVPMQPVGTEAGSSAEHRPSTLEPPGRGLRPWQGSLHTPDVSESGNASV